MIRATLVGAVLALSALAAFATTAHAQPAAALGHPLPAAELPVGTIMVRVIAGSPQSPVAGTDVTLTVNGTPRQARTDAAGRATFAGLPAGATVQAKVDTDGTSVSSDAFPVPDEGGARVMISTKPFQPGAGGGAPFAGGGGGEGGGAMPEPRQISGQGRAQKGDPAGQLVILITYDDLHDKTPAANVPVTLVGYASDDSVSVVTVPSAADGRATFTKLDVTGNTAYYAMAQLPRNGTIDRLYSQPLIIGSEAGVRMLLSGAKRDAKDPAVDDLTTLERDNVAIAAGKVRVVIDTSPGFAGEVQLVDAKTHAVVAHAPTAPDSDNAEVQTSAQADDTADLPPGTFDVQILGGQGQTEDPMPDITVSVAQADGKGTPVSATTGPDGVAHLVTTPGKQMQAVLTIRGRQQVSKPFDLSKHGAKLVVRAHWDGGRPEAVLDFAAAPGQVLYAQTTTAGTRTAKPGTYRSLPFQAVADHGTAVTLYVYPRTLMTFRLFAGIEDQLLAVQGQIKMENFSWSPFAATADGLEIPLPKGFKGPVVFNNSQEVAAVDASIGFRISKPLPPMGVTFEGGWSQPVTDGEVSWSFDMPYGAYGSMMQIVEFPSMQVDLPPEIKGEEGTGQTGTKFFVMPQIAEQAGHPFVMTIRGLPSQPAWKLWAPRVIGAFALLVMLAGVGIGVFRKRAPTNDALATTRLNDSDKAARAAKARSARRTKLMDELVALESAGSAQPSGRREAVIAELEELWEQT